MLLVEKKSSGLTMAYRNLQVLDLSRNALSDGCFVNLIGLAKISPSLANIFLNSNRIKLLPMGVFKREFKENFRSSRLSLSPRLSTNLSNNSYL